MARDEAQRGAEAGGGWRAGASPLRAWILGMSLSMLQLCQVFFCGTLSCPVFAGLTAGIRQRECGGAAGFRTGHETTVSVAFNTATQDTLVGQAGREQLLGTEDLSMLVCGLIELAGL